MRDTKYARELASTSIEYAGGSSAKVERIFVKAEKQEEIRLSWWKGKRMMLRPLDVPVEDLVQLLASGVRDGVLPANFARTLAERIKAAG